MFAFSRPFQANGLLTRKSMLRAAYTQFVYVLAGADHERMEEMRQMMSELVAGWEVTTVREIVNDTLHHVIDPMVYDEAVQLIAEHHDAGRDVVIVSASGEDVARPVGELLGADHVIGTRVEVVDGRYTGEISFYAYAENKAIAIRELAEQRGYDLAASYAYSDSMTDVAMLETVGHPFAVNPDKELRRIARERGWPILVFSRPVALRSRLPLPPARPTIAALAVGGAVALGGVLWAGARRRRLTA